MTAAPFMPPVATLLVATRAWCFRDTPKKRVLAPAGEHLLRIGVDAAVTKILGGG
jgi:hypothetical protein